MKPRGIHLQYTFEARGQDGAPIENPLFDLLSALKNEGSISHAAKALQLSYRLVWGSLKRWEEVPGSPLVLWVKGQRALLDGRCKVAGFHVPRVAPGPSLFAQALRPLLRPGKHKLIGSAGPQAGCCWSTAWRVRARGACRTTCRPSPARARMLQALPG